MNHQPQSCQPAVIVNKRTARLRQVQEDAPDKVGLFKRVYAATASPRQCIRAFCLECCGMDKAAINGCTAPICPLFNFRPYQSGGAA